MNLKESTALEIADLIAEDAILPHSHQTISTLLTDSRKLSDHAKALFFVLKGRKDAHAFIPQLYKEGVKSFVYYQKDLDTSVYPDANFIYVEEPLQALQKLASRHRLAYHYPVIGITGSNGKTIVKDWLTNYWRPAFKIVRSPKSFNSQIGVPLSVWQMNGQFDFAIFEAGISLPNEMEKLAQIIKPTIGILTSIGSAHNEGFDNEEQKIKEKFKLFDGVELLICNQKFIKYKK